jgi:hypothetical protein
VFEKSAIEDMINRSTVGGVACPTPGCRKMLTLKLLRDDPALLRKANREMERERRRKDKEGSGDEEEGDEDDAMDIDAFAKGKVGKKIKAENAPARRRSAGRGKAQAIESGDDAMDEGDD